MKGRPVARTVDPERHLARRLQIIDAAITCFSADGYAGTTTAAICRTAGIGSGTFFHYFPTKQDLLVEILALGTAETRDWFAARPADDDPLAVVEDYVAHAVDEMSDARMAGFVRAVGAVMGQPDVEAALEADTRAIEEGLGPLLDRARDAGQVRDDVPAADLTQWVIAVVDGFLGRLAVEERFTVAGQRAMLVDVVRRLLARA